MKRALALALLLASPVFAGDNPTVSMETNYGTLKIELYLDDAPNTVVSFLTLAEKKFYDGIKFHRIIKRFMAQGGDPKGNGSGGPGYSLPAEFNARKHVKGTLSMARTFEPNSAGSQFFLCFTETSFLDNQYTVFGQVTEGLDVLTKIEEEAGADRDPQPPRAEVKIVSVKVLSKPEKLPELVTIKPEDMACFGVIPNMKESTGGLVVGQLYPKGGGQASGLQVGDKIVKVGEAEVTDLLSYAKAILPARPGKPITVKVLRKGEEKTIEVTPTLLER
jgi:peptidylprolyl isomerase/peptidyl-prolyl cis-trans isomerase B (cyclophilin B)